MVSLHSYATSMHELKHARKHTHTFKLTNTHAYETNVFVRPAGEGEGAFLIADDLKY